MGLREQVDVDATCVLAQRTPLKAARWKAGRGKEERSAELLKRREEAILIARREQKELLYREEKLRRRGCEGPRALGSLGK